MITIKRIIHPVGHGGFCTETFCDHVAKNAFTIAYDIGTFSSEGKEYIKTWLHNNRVDIVVLSHLHNDHINCLGELLKINPYVKIVMPQMTNGEILEALIHNGDIMICDMEINAFLNLKNIITIKKTLNREPVDFSNLTNIEEAEGTPQQALFQKDFFWKYYFYNPTTKSEDLITAIKNSTMAISPIISKDAIDYAKLKEIFLDADLKRKLKKIYEDVFKDHNSYSMCMYSGVVDKGYKFRLKIDNSGYLENHKPGCIYTGDIPLKSVEQIDTFCDYYRKDINDVGLVQIPHHGSKNNFNEKILENISNTDFFICSGKNFSNKCVVNTIVKKNRTVKRVIEKSEEYQIDVIYQKSLCESKNK